MNEPVIFFDLGGVLMDFRGFDILRAQGLDLPDDQEIRARWLRSPSVVAYERGAISSPEFARKAVEEFGLTLSPEAFLASFATWVQGFYPGARELVARLRRRYKVGCLSNCNELHWGEHMEGLFDYPLASHLIGVGKPHPEAFQKMAEVSGRPLHEIVFFDDSLVNVEAAKALGIRAFLVRSPAEIEAICRAEGLG